MAKILIVEDDVEVAESLVKFLKSRGHDSSYALDGEETLSNIAKNKPEVIFLDIQLPNGQSGVEVLDKVKKTDPQIKIIMMTGYVGEETEEECKKLGANGYMIKPVDFPKMLNMVKEFEKK